MPLCLSRGLGGFSALLLVACGPDVKYATDHLEIAPYFDAPVCEGTARDLEAFASDLEQTMGLTPGERIRIYWGPEGVDEHCDASWRVGCFSLDHPRAVFVDDQSVIFHELVHVYGHRLAGSFSTPFIEEAIAHALTGSPLAATNFPSDPGTTIAVTRATYLADPSSVDLTTATHFITFLIEHHGIERVLALKKKVPNGRSVQQIEAAFQEVFELPLAAMFARWAVEAPSSYVATVDRPASSIPWTAQNWTYTAELDCERPETRGPLVNPKLFLADEPPGGMYQTVTFDLLRTTKLRAEISGDPGGEAIITGEDCFEQDSFMWVPHGEPREDYFPACRWQVTLLSRHADPTSVTLSLTVIE